METEAGTSEKYPAHLALHYLAGSSTVFALDNAKRLLDKKSHPIDFQDPSSGLLTPLHIAAHWGNLAMCQLFIHYNAKLDLKDEDGNLPLDLAEDKKVRKFLKKMSAASTPKEKKRIRTILSELFRLKSNAFQKNKQSKRPVSCFPAFAIPTEVIRRRSSTLVFKQQTDEDLQQMMASLSIVEKKSKQMEIKENSIPEKVAVQSPKSIYPALNISTTPSPPLRITSIQPTVHNVTPTVTPPAVQNVTPSYVTLRAHQLQKFTRTPTAPMESDEEVIETPKTPDVPLEIRQLSMEQLKKRLENVGISPGPMKKDTRRFYEKRLLVAEKENVQAYKNQEYSNSLDRMIRMVEKGMDIKMGRTQEDIIRKEFCEAPIITREKNETSSFCYILIDPTKIPDQRNCTLREFINASFYIGKGKRARPLQHLVDAAKCKRQENLRGKDISNKFKRIYDIWKSGNGVISLHIFLNIHPLEAFIREGSMIDAFGKENLTNAKGGEYYGEAKSWTLKEKTEFGSYCLYSAWQIFRNERCRQIFERDVADALNMKFFY